MFLYDLRNSKPNGPTCLWSVPRPPKFNPLECFGFPHFFGGPLENTIRMRVLPMPITLTGITVVCEDSCSLDLHLHSGNVKEDAEFYARATRFSSPEFRYLSLAPGDKIMEIAVRNFWHTSAKFPCIAVLISNGKKTTFGPYIPTDRRQYYSYSRISNPDTEEVTCLCVNEVDSKDPYIRIGVKGRVSTFSRADRREKIPNWWISELPTFMPSLNAHSGIFWDKVDTGKYDTFYSCTERKEGLERCIGLMFGAEVLGQWRTDMTVKQHSLPSSFALRNIRHGRYNNVFVDTASPHGGERIEIRGVLEWWSRFSYDEIGYYTGRSIDSA